MYHSKRKNYLYKFKLENRFYVCVLLIFGLLYSGCQADNNSNRNGVEAADEEWTILFDGESIDHWRGYNMDGLPDGWLIEGDELVFRPEEGMNTTDIITNEKYSDFEFRAEYNISEGGNSGIFHHVIEQPGQAIFWSGPEMQILDNEAYPGNEDFQRSGSLYDLLPADPQNTLPPGEWNSVRIISEGADMEYWQNGEKVVEFTRWSPEWFEMVRNSKFECHPSFGTVPEGHIGLQDHGDEVRFRNIKIRRLN